MSWLPDNDPYWATSNHATRSNWSLCRGPATLAMGSSAARAAAWQASDGRTLHLFDHFGPVQFMSGKGMDVRPHPHIGLATVTYLFDGSIMHRDSEAISRKSSPAR